VAVALGEHHTCALLDTGAVRCWGHAAGGVLGYGNLNAIGDDEPVWVAGDVNLAGAAVALAANSGHTCAVMAGGGLRCWGEYATGYPNSGTIGDDEVPADLGDVQVGGTVLEVAAGRWHTCVLLDGGGVRCFGAGFAGALGYGNTDDVGTTEDPAVAGDVPIGALVEGIAAGYSHTCALLVGGTLRCWGGNAYGQLGYGHTTSIGADDLPTDHPPVPVGEAVAAVEAGGEVSCARLVSGGLKCWGDNRFGQLGQAHRDSLGDDEPASDIGPIELGGQAVEVSVAKIHSCVLRDDGLVVCMGLGRSGQLGLGNTRSVGDNETPAEGCCALLFEPL
jgi:alpha-tubulin suppressor-like RCC1 family protein